MKQHPPSSLKGNTRVVFLHVSNVSLTLQTAMRNSSRPYIVKPSAKGEGHGIFVVNTIEELDAHFTDGYVVQPLLTDPYLIQGKKFDFRYSVHIHERKKQGNTSKAESTCKRSTGATRIRTHDHHASSQCSTNLVPTKL